MAPFALHSLKQDNPSSPYPLQIPSIGAPPVWVRSQVLARQLKQFSIAEHDLGEVDKIIPAGYPLWFLGGY